MSRKTQRYSKEFKAEAVRTVPENQLSISEGASRLSLPEGTLGQWVTAARKGLGTPGSRTVAELESEILQLLPIEAMCQVFGVSRSGYYNWVQHEPSDRKLFLVA
ncbi:IS600 ORF2 [Shigella sonnei]|nr:IS600 ORF2 [Shigella sonnei]